VELSKDSLRRLIVEGREQGRFTQDSPVMVDVWLKFADPEVETVDILLTPTKSVDPASLAADVRERLGDATAAAEIAYSGSYVAARLNLRQLVQGVLPLSEWWAQIWSPQRHAERPTSEVEWLAMVLGAILTLREEGQEAQQHLEVADDELVDRGSELLRREQEYSPHPPPGSLWRATLNRPAYPAVARSRETVKADAVTRLFEVDCSGLAWAIVDTGIDATHPAFRRWKAPGELYEEPFEASGANRTRIEATYDLTLLRSAQHAIQNSQHGPGDPAVEQLVDEHGSELESMRTHLLNRRPLDWAALEPLLRVQHTPGDYRPPADDHGTHVAGILAADWPAARAEGADYELVGLCPDLRLYDLRVFPPDRTRGDEFTVAAALQFIDYLNGFGRKISVAGANVSLSVPYELLAFGCGQTPVCQESNRLVAGGVVVVAAAGNRGREEYVLETELVEGFRLVSLTDPGNAEDVITVGSTHATNPHAYGISYFSSRGPTGDGRLKPDLVAPGEKIQAPGVGRRMSVMDGTSQAAPHVSGAAALLLARHRELIGKPQRVKRLLMEAATDLGREPYFQGAGLVDALRAAQAN
jgi:serine protease AprX